MDGVRFRSHDLRHVAASSLIASGPSVAAVQAMLGHSTPSETLGVYTHFWVTDGERTREAIGRVSAGWLRWLASRLWRWCRFDVGSARHPLASLLVTVRGG